MADRLQFSLVSPERELFVGEVDQVDVPGAEGDFGVLPRHAPMMTTIRPGAIRVSDGGDVRSIFIRGGFAEVNPEGLTILAEQAVDLAEVDPGKAAQDIKNAEEDVADARDDETRAEAQTRLDAAREIAAALSAA